MATHYSHLMTKDPAYRAVEHCWPPKIVEDHSWSQQLLRSTDLTQKELNLQKEKAIETGQTLRNRLTLVHDIPEYQISRAIATHYKSLQIDTYALDPHPKLVEKWGIERCLKDQILPWKTSGHCTIILAADPEQYLQNKHGLESCFGQVRLALITTELLQKTICKLFDSQLIDNAEHRTQSHLSCRQTSSAFFISITVLCALVLITAVIAHTALTAFTLLAFLAMILQTLIKWGGIYHAVSQKIRPNRDVIPTHFPTITVFVPLFKENAIASHLLTHLKALNYPREHLDICLVTEEQDSCTQSYLKTVNLPKWIRTIIVPHGSLQTKPRALNYALNFAKGSIIGIYDAEDAPAPNQLRDIAIRFANRSENVVCLQGVLDFYNSSRNVMTRCFTAEYASWFRVLLPGVSNMGFVVPLGGTTLFFRRNVLEKLGAWDAHNVTEDADLGVRLCRYGYTTELVNTTTFEEANGRAWSWVKQRSRWLKGYAITYGVHMRNPAQLYKDLGSWRFWGFQVQFLGALLSIFLSPLLLSFWLLMFGFYHPIEAYMSESIIITMAALCVVAELTNAVVAAIGLHKADKLHIIKYIPLMIPYNMLAILALYKGLLELAWKPFYWDKTDHGLLLPEDNKDIHQTP